MITDNLTAEEHEVVRDVRSALENGGTLPIGHIQTLLEIIRRLGFNVSAMRSDLILKHLDIEHFEKSINAHDADRRMLESENRNMSNRIADLENTNSILTASIEESENKNANTASLRIKIAKLEAENSALRHELEMAKCSDYRIEVISGVEVPSHPGGRIEELENIVIAARDKNRELTRCSCKLPPCEDGNDWYGLVYTSSTDLPILARCNFERGFFVEKIIDGELYWLYLFPSLHSVFYWCNFPELPY